MGESSFQFSAFRAGGWNLAKIFLRFESSGDFTSQKTVLDFWKMFFMSRGILFLP
jgi:hypothetical protein